jgi:anti-sigma B factor antagonist
MLHIKSEVDGDGRIVVAAAGSVDLATAPQLAGALAQAHRDGRAGIVVDLAAVDFLDSAGVRVLVEAARQGSTLSIRGAQGWVARVLDITGVQDYLGTDPSQRSPRG